MWLLEVFIGIGLLVGAVLARKKRYRAHAWCQSAVVLLNGVLIAVAMIPSFRESVRPKVPEKLDRSFYALATAHATLGRLAEAGGLYLQSLDAERPDSLLVGAPARVGNLHSLVRSSLQVAVISFRPRDLSEL
jgi:hypothetical protein